MTDRPNSPIGRRAVIGLLAAAIIGSLTWWLASGSSSETAIRADGGSVIEEFRSGDRVMAEPFAARLLDGSTLDTSTLRGEVVVYNVWGSWCVPCATEAPDLVEVANEFNSQVTFVGINVRDNESAARAFEREYSIPYDSVAANDSAEAMLSFNGSLATAAVPTTLVVDRDGRVAARVIGPVTAPTLRSLLRPVLAELSNGGQPAR